MVGAFAVLIERRPPPRVSVRNASPSTARSVGQLIATDPAPTCSIYGPSVIRTFGLSLGSWRAQTHQTERLTSQIRNSLGNILNMSSSATLCVLCGFKIVISAS